MIWRLKDWRGDTPLPPSGAYWTAAQCVDARAELVRGGLYYDGSNATVWEDGVCVERYSDQASWGPEDDTAEAADWVFVRYISARAARMENRRRAA